MIFTDRRGRRLPSCGRAAPPGERPPPATGRWVHPTGERLDPHCVYFNESDELVPA
ncbi:MAG: hypothetical protein ACRD1D_04560 [Acidimicrobiales bacterium]